MTDGNQSGKGGRRLTGKRHVQRSYWLRKEDAVGLETLKGQVLLESDLNNVDLSAAIRGLIRYALALREEQGSGWHTLKRAIEAAHRKETGEEPLPFQ